MTIFIRVKNKLRTAFIRGPLRAMAIRGTDRASSRICFVAATRLSEERFWRESPLALSLRTHLQDPSVTLQVAFNNKKGLPEIYNEAIANQEADIMVFIHDDIWIKDLKILEKIREAVKSFDIVGLAGNTRISKKQPAWLFKKLDGTNFIWDHGYLSGEVFHGSPENPELSVFGPTPAACELIDGLFIAASKKQLTSSKVYFDELFDFHFYDLDFCRTARKKGLSIGTWPIGILHISKGAFGSPSWREGYKSYFSKWKT